MFDAICIRQQSTVDAERLINLGFLAEAMLFYKDVLVIANRTTLRQLATYCSPEVLIELLEEGYLRIKYDHTVSGIYTRNSNTPEELHAPVTTCMERAELQHFAPELFTKVTGRTGRGGRLARRFISLVETREYEPSLLEHTLVDFADVGYIENGVGRLLQVSAPAYELPKPLVFNVEPVGEEFRVHTNVNFEAVNRSYHTLVPATHSSLTPALILSRFLTVRENTYYASTFSAEVATDEVSSALLQLRIEDALGRRAESDQQISAFQDFVFDESRAVQVAINSGKRNFRELLPILSSAGKFKNWLHDQPANEHLVKEYFRAATESSWVDKLPSKSIRWVIFTGAGIALDVMGTGGLGTALGIGLSAGDTFFLDKIVKGWKPNQFVEGSLRKFL